MCVGGGGGGGGEGGGGERERVSNSAVCMALNIANARCEKQNVRVNLYSLVNKLVVCVCVCVCACVQV